MWKIIYLLSPVYVTLFWSLVLNLNPGKSHAPKVFLGRFMLVACVIYLSHFFYFMELFEVYRLMDSFYIFASLLVFPLYHIYVRILTVDQSFSLKLHGIFLVVPFSIYLLSLGGYMQMSSEQQVQYLSTVIPGKIGEEGILAYMKIIYLFYKIVFLLQVFIYLWLNFLLITRNNKNLEHFYSNLDEKKLGWVQFFNITLAITSVGSGVMVVLGREHFLGNGSMLVYPSILFSSMLFCIGYLGNKQGPVRLYQSDSPLVLKNTEDTVPTWLKSRLEDLMLKQELFKDKELKIWDVSSMLGTNRTYVSKVINQEYGVNFCTFVNQFRVDYAKEIARVTPELTHDEISDLAGFGSLNSFYRAFAHKEGIGFGEYRRNLAGDLGKYIG